MHRLSILPVGASLIKENLHLSIGLLIVIDHKGFDVFVNTVTDSLECSEIDFVNLLLSGILRRYSAIVINLPIDFFDGRVVHKNCHFLSGLRRSNVGKNVLWAQRFAGGALPRGARGLRARNAALMKA